MNDNNVPITEATLTQLINQLLHEDKKEDAQHVLDNDFERYGVQPNDVTRKTMATADKLASIGRTNKLESLLKADGKEASMKYLQEMMNNGKADFINCGWAMKELCNTSNEARDIINQMNENNITVDEVILNHRFNNTNFFAIVPKSIATKSGTKEKEGTQTFHASCKPIFRIETYYKI